jgi:hypothetical protein
MIDVDMINTRREELVEDLNKVRLRQEEIEKAKLENVALQNALTGAIQQCDDFLRKLNNGESETLEYPIVDSDGSHDSNGDEG